MRYRCALAVMAMLAWGAPSHAASPDTTLKIGLLAELSGIFAPSGNGERNGLQLYLNSHDGKLGGLKVELLAEDTTGDPAVAIIKLKKLIESDKIDALIGPTNSAVALAIKSVIAEHKLPTFAGATDEAALDGKYIFRTTFWGPGDSYITGRLLAASGVKSMVAMAPTYVAGQDAVDSAQRGFKDGGGLKSMAIMPRLGILDYGSFISQFPSDAQAAFVFLPGTDGVRFIKQYADYGKPLPLYGPSVTVDEQQLPVLGKAAEGFVAVGSYFTTIDTPENKKLMALWGSGFQGQFRPTWQTVGGYIAGQILDKVIAGLGGKIDDTDALVAAIAAVKLETPRGLFSFSKERDAVAPRYVAQIRDVGGTIQPVILAVTAPLIPGEPQSAVPEGFTLPR